MDFDPDEFPCHASPDNEVVELNYFAQELDFMPLPDFLDDPQLRDMRAEALTIIVQCTTNRNYDVYAPYLAMNYYDRYISRNPMPLGRRNNFYTAICCLVIAFKMRDDDFCVTDFKEAEGLERIISRATLEKVEREILNGINWRLCCITPFSFLQYYYPRYKELGGFKLNSVTNIIFQAQTDNNLVRFRHSEIAASSLMAATAMVYTKEFLKDFVNDVGWSPCVCVCELIQMISAKNIIVERAETRRLNNDEASTSRNNGNDDSPEAAPDDEQAIIPKRHGKEVASSSSQNDHHHDSLTLEDNDRATLIRSRPGQEVASSSSQNDHHHDSLKLEDDNLSTPRRTAKEVASSSSQNDHHDPLTLEEDHQANLRRPGKEVASSSSQNDHYTLGDDNQATPRRPEKEVASSSSQNDQHDSLTLEDGDQATPRRPGKEVASSSTQNDHHHDSLTLEDDDQATSRRPGKDVMAFASEIDNDPLAVTDEPEFIRRAGKEVVTVSQSDSSVAGDDEIIEDTISLLKELGFTSITTDPFLTFRDQPEFQWILDSSVENDEPLVTDQLENPWESSGSMVALPSLGDPSEIPSTSGSMVVFTSQGNSSEVTEDQEIPSTSGSLVVYTSQGNSSVENDEPLVTDELENPWESPGSMVALPSLGDPSEVTEEQEIPRRPGKEVLTATSQVGPSEITEEQEIPRRPGKEVLTTTSHVDPSEVTEEQEIPRRPGKEVLTTSQVDPSEEVTDEQGIPRKLGKEEKRRRLVAALDAALDAGLKAALEETNETQQNLLEASQKFTREVELARNSLEAQPATSDTEASRRVITTLQSLFDASRRSIRRPSEISEISFRTWIEIISDMSEDEESQSKLAKSGNSEIEVQPPSTLEIDTPASRRNMWDRCGGGDRSDRFNTCCNVL